MAGFLSRVRTTVGQFSALIFQKVAFLERPNPPLNRNVGKLDIPDIYDNVLRSKGVETN